MSGRRPIFLLILVTLVSLHPFAHPGAGKDGSIDVVLVDNEDHALSGATIILQGPIPIITGPSVLPAAPIPLPPETGAVTDRNGHAGFKGLAPGQYNLRAQKDGYIAPSMYGIQFIPTAASTVAYVQEGQKTPEIALTLLRGATISGKVTDAAKAPVAGMRMYACSLALQNGRRTLQTRASAQTDDRGDYRLFWFGPGEYYLFGEPLPRAGASRLPEFARTFYPGVTEFSGAKPVALSGADVTGMDFMVQNTKTFNVRGKILDLPSAPPGPFNQMPSFTYTPRDPDEVDVPYSRSTPVRMNYKTGEFELLGIPQGSWNLFATLPAPNVSKDPSKGNWPQYLGGRVAINVIDKDIEDVRIILYSVVVKGKVIIPKSGSPSGLSTANLHVNLQPRESMPSIFFAMLQSSLPIASDGNFEFRGVLPGRYGISVSMPAGIADIRVGSKSVMNDGIINVGTESPDAISIVLADKMIGISGMVMGITPETTVAQLASTRAILIPNPPRRRNALLYKTAEISSVRGNFYLSAISPGAYTLFAVEGWQPGAELDPAFISRYEGRGITVNVGEEQITRSFQVRWLRK